MPIALTSQEKKVLGFIVLMVALGLVMLGLKRLSASKPKTAETTASTAPTALNKAP
jgi:hypothetical protein